MNLSDYTYSSTASGNKGLVTPDYFEAEIKEFIVDTFALHYGAKVESFCSQLLDVRDYSGELVAAAGYTLAEDSELFLEQYLDQPLEDELENRLGFRPSRFDLVEVGNLAAKQPGSARLLIRLLTQHLHQLGRKYVVFTATSSLINSFSRLGLQPVKLARAQSDRVKRPELWGSYYKQNPYVVFGDIGLGYAHMDELQLLLPMEGLQ